MASTDREVICPYCHVPFLVKTNWRTTEMLCGSCGELIDMVKYSQKSDPSAPKSNEPEKLNKNSTRSWLHGRMAVVPTPAKKALGGAKANRLPMLTGVANVSDDDEDGNHKGNKRTLPKKNTKAKRKKSDSSDTSSPDTESDSSSEDIPKNKKKKTQTAKKQNVSAKNTQKPKPKPEPKQKPKPKEEPKAKPKEQSKSKPKPKPKAKEESDSDSDDNINHENKMDDNIQIKSTELLKEYGDKKHNVSNKVYKINSRPKDDKSDANEEEEEWEELGVEEDEEVNTQKGNKPVTYIDDEDDAKNIVTSTKGLDLEESDDEWQEESVSKSSSKKKRKVKKPPKVKKNKKSKPKGKR